MTMWENCPEWVIFLIKRKLLWATYFSCKTYVVLLTYTVQILQKLQVKPNQQHLFVIDLFRASKNHLECQSNISTDLPLLFPSHSKLKSSLHWHFAVSKSQSHWNLMEVKKSHTSSALCIWVPSIPTFSNHTLLQEEIKHFGFLSVQ